MTRPLRAGAPTHPVTIRATDGERAMWERAGKLTGAKNLSDAIVKQMNAWAAGVLAANPAKRRSKP